MDNKEIKDFMSGPEEVEPNYCGEFGFQFGIPGLLEAAESAQPRPNTITQEKLLREFQLLLKGKEQKLLHSKQILNTIKLN